jgi:long-chain acyl-CoA synthetase
MTEMTSRLNQIVGGLTRAGAPFEMVEEAEPAGPFRKWKNGPQTLLDIFASTRQFESREFVVLGDQRVSYGAFRKAAMHLAGWLGEQGIGGGDVVAIMLANRPEWLVGFFGVALAGATSALVNAAATTSEVAHTFKLASPTLVICDADKLESLTAADALPAGARILVIGAGTSTATSGLNVTWSEAIVGAVETWSQLDAAVQPAPVIDPSAVASILFTAGTTGQPKGVMLSHRACAYSVFHAGFRNAREAALANRPPVQLEGQQVLLMALPFFHTSGICNAVLPLMMRGGRIVLMGFWSPRLASRLIRSEGVNIVGSIPMILEQLVSEFASDPPPDSLHQMICGGGPPSPALAPNIATLGVSPGQNWGMTETAGALLGIIASEFVARPGSCGLPSPIHDVRVVSAAGDLLPAGAVGELQVRGPQIMLGYYNDPDATAASLHDGWLRTGDLAFLDADGYCFIVDRAKDMLICAGENVYCIEVENVIASHPGVEEVAVLGIPHALMGEQPVAVVRLHQGVALTDQDVRNHAAKQLQLFKTPTRILVVGQPLPRNRLGKVQKRELRRWFDA